MHCILQNKDDNIHKYHKTIKYELTNGLSESRKCLVVIKKKDKDGQKEVKIKAAIKLLKSSRTAMYVIWLNMPRNDGNVDETNNARRKPK